jgi:Meiotically up-regulated gene 113
MKEALTFICHMGFERSFITFILTRMRPATNNNFYNYTIATGNADPQHPQPSPPLTRNTTNRAINGQYRRGLSTPVVAPTRTRTYQRQIYFIEAHDKHIKIGISTLAKSRVSQLQGANPEELRLLHAVDGADGTDETQLHLLLAPWHVRGEWFNFGLSDDDFRQTLQQHNDGNIDDLLKAIANFATDRICLMPGTEFNQPGRSHDKNGRFKSSFDNKTEEINPQ